MIATFIILWILTLTAWIVSDIRHRHECKCLNEQHYHQVRRANDISTDYAKLFQEKQELIRQIGKPTGVVFLPEKSYYADRQDLYRELEKARKDFFTLQRRLAAVSKALNNPVPDP